MGASVGLRELQWRRIGKERQESSLQPCSEGFGTFEIFGYANFITEYKLVYVLRCRSTNNALADS